MFAKVHGARAMGELMQFMGYQAIALGNHDIEYAAQLPPNFPALSVNIPEFANSTIIKIQKATIGILAYTTTDSLTIDEVVRSIQEEALCLRFNGAEIVILLAHGAADMDKRIAEQTVGYLDIILGGHTHTLLGCTQGKAYHNGSTVMLNPGAAGEFLGVLKINRTAGKTTYHSELIPIEPSILEDPAVVQYLAPLIAALPANNRLVAKLDVAGAPDQAESCRKGVCITGGVVAEALRWHHDCHVIALFEAGSIRDVFHSHITEFDLISTLPWDNYVVLYQINGRNLLRMLQHGARSLAHSGEAYLHTAGVQYEAHSHNAYLETEDAKSTKTKGDGDFLDAMRRQNRSKSACNVYSKRRTHLPSSTTQQVDPSGLYTIAVTDWLAGGGDGYAPFLAEATRLPNSTHSDSVFVRQMVEEYLSSAPNNVEPSTAGLDSSELRWRLHSATRSAVYSGGHVTSQENAEADYFDGTINRGTVGIWASVAKHLHLGRSGTSGMRSLIAILAEIPSTLVSHPLRTISTRQQSKTHNASNSSGGVWNGALLTLVAVMASKTVFWLVYYFALEEFSAASGLVVRAVQQGLLGFYASMLAGVCECVVVHPLWVIVIRIQVFGNKVKNLYVNMCDGLGFSLLLVLFPCIRQFMFEYFLYIYDNLLELRTAPFISGAIGTVATITATVLSYPIQTLRTQMQTNSFDRIFSMKLFAGLGAKILSSAVQAFCFFFCKKLLEIILLEN